MPIAQLSEKTARAIVSSLALNDTSSVIKELIDNALDANANIISIEVSANTLDIIQVKDNGVGIGIEDRQLLCRRGYTSKIRTLEDLVSLGGKSLGFRGEALASIAELSTSVTITTRVDGEITASALKYSSDAKLLSSASVSHPVGTTIRVQDFLKSLPVRKQTAIKTTSRTLSSIRRLLYSYAFARPTIRFIFKILKAKNENSNWTYAPSPKNFSFREVAMKIVGKEVAGQCKEFTIEGDETNSEADNRWSLTGLLVSADTDLEISSPYNKYISIDGRPVATERGAMKELIKLYKSYLQNVFGKSSSCSKAFLCVHIHCPDDSYDVNIEPAKNEVLFADHSILLNLFTKLLKNMYGEIISETSEEHEHPTSPENGITSSFNYLLAAKPISIPEAEQTIVSSRQIISPIPHPLSIFNDIEDETSPTVDFSTDNEDDGDLPSFTNPWSSAKMNSRIIPSGNAPAQETQIMVPSQYDQTNQLLTPNTSPQQQLPFQNPGPPIRRRQILDEVSGDDYSPRRDATRSILSDDNSSMLESWIKPQAKSKPFVSPLKRTPQSSQFDQTITGSTAIQSSSPSNPITSSQSELEEILDFERKKKAAIAQQRLNFNKALPRGGLLGGPERDFVLASRLHQVPTDRLDGEHGHSSSQISISEEDLNKRFGQNSETSPQRLSKSSPHTNRYLAALKSLSQPEATTRNLSLETDDELVTGLAADDPRAYYMKYRKDPKRAKISRLPFETIPAHTATYDYKLQYEEMPESVDDFNPLLSTLASVDDYVRTGNNAFVRWSAFSEDVEEWETTIKEQIRSNFRVRIDDDELVIPDIELSLARAIEAHIDDQ